MVQPAWIWVIPYFFWNDLGKFGISWEILPPIKQFILQMSREKYDFEAFLSSFITNTNILFLLQVNLISYEIYFHQILTFCLQNTFPHILG